MKTSLPLTSTVFAALILISGSILAEERSRKPRTGLQAPPPASLAPEARARVSNSRAASLVKRRDSSARVIGVSLLNSGGSPVYKVRTLSSDGVVKSVFVDAMTGEVFE